VELKDKTVLVVGLGRTGRDSARFLAQQGARVLVSDLHPEAALRAEMAELQDVEIEYRLGGEEPDCLDGVDYVIPSPGVGRQNALLQEASARRIPILSEIELAYRFSGAPIIAITGTNGKSTTTTLVGEILRAVGKRVFVGGNLGVPFISAVSDDWDWIVLEISSFQLEWVNKAVLMVPTATVYKVPAGSTNIKEGQLIGRIEARGIYRFPLDKSFQVPGADNYELLLYDFIHQQVIDSIHF